MDAVHEAEGHLSCLEISSPQVAATERTETNKKTGVQDLPAELLCEIFEHFIAEPAVVSARGPSTPAALTQVCRIWRKVAFSTPRLWDDIVIECGDWSNIIHLTQAVREHLGRSNELPITIHATGKASYNSNGAAGGRISNLLLPYANRTQHLTLAFPSECMNQFLQTAVPGFQIPALESVTLVYHNIQRNNDLLPIRAFANAPRLRKFEVKYELESLTYWFLHVSGTLFELPWDQLTELNLIHLILSPEAVPRILKRCPNLESCALTAAKEVSPEEATYHPTSDTILPSIRNLTLYNPKNYHYSNYLARIQFPNLERLSIQFIGGHEGRLVRKWEQRQLIALLERSQCQLRALSTTANISPDEIEEVLGDVPSLRELDVLEGECISTSTLRLMNCGYISPNLDTIKCAIEPSMLSDFLDMLDCRL
ncbi:hypothetical protein DXG03_007242 [Asterophora parasitica]|uniref:F-box domain-containing protein n=1 Tax=Asterophora parasitica TaxID=117018 RepID=A0A9P7G2B1_9AGAR|nr:hypothetical protein DXG03_007242 [Asterophora parasitica]